MEPAGVTDLRGDAVLPLALRVLGKPRRPAAARARSTSCAPGSATAAQRNDANGDGTYEHADAIRIMDAWWPLWVRAQFRPALGAKACDALLAAVELDNHPTTTATTSGSAWQNGWYGFVRKDLRTRAQAQGPRPVLAHVLRRRQAAALPAGAAALAARRDRRRARRHLRRRRGLHGRGPHSDQACFDAIWHRPLGGVTQPLIPWQNRPTFQQVVEIQGPAGR